ncbi:GtrA family protein [Saezia sanguinis]|uniref:GtrA family protein n=1 Tax=Saezia sanguinis TaxID=1965230 RepID=UPI0030245A76
MMNLRQLIDYLMRYAFSSICAVLLDIALYAFLIWAIQLSPFYANAISSVVSVIVVWFLSGRYLFAAHRISLKKYITWYVYQFIVILIYSAMVKGLVDYGVNELLSKLLITALSFVINSTFFKLVILKK